MSSAARPSDGRRAALRRADEGDWVEVSNFFPIERYYQAADKVLHSFEHAYSEKRLDDAYVLGKRFARFSLESLPKHNYFRSPKYTALRKRNDANVQTVLTKLEQVAKWMDVEEAEKQRLRLEYEKRRKQEQVRRQEAIERARYLELEQRIEEQRKKSSRSSSSQNVEQSALSKLQMLTTNDESGTQASTPDDSKGDGHDRPALSSQRSISARARRSRWQQDEASSISSPILGGDDAVLPPPIPPPPDGSKLSPPPPPSYDQVVSKEKGANHNMYPLAAPAGGAIIRSQSDVLPEPAEVAEPLVPPPPYSFYDRDSTHIIQPPKVVPVRIPIRKLSDKCSTDLARLKQQRKIEIFGLNTYQGRYRNSTNGCTVISPLVVSHHLNEPGSVADSTIVSVIDKECPPLLREIRRKLELEGDALIIPSDVHDHLVDRKILIQSKFSGACGGNILDDKHVGEFLRILEEGEDGKYKNHKTGAALFFHEHVVSIVKVPFGGGDRFCYDMIDSMPRLTDAQNGNKMMASRTRCHGIGAFATLLKWYACGKFSPTNCTYIDRNEWNESMADFDPRVFQAFVWTE